LKTRVTVWIAELSVQRSKALSITYRCYELEGHPGKLPK
jgi:hypothetical protein